MVGVGRNLWRLSSPAALLKQAHLEQVAQGCVQTGFVSLQRKRLHNLFVQPAPVLCHPQCKEVFPHIQMALPVFQFVPIAPYPVAGHQWKESGPILLTPTIDIFVRIDKIPSQSFLLQGKQTQLSQPVLIREMLQTPDCLCSPLLYPLQVVSCLSCTGEPRTGCSTPGKSSRG